MRSKIQEFKLAVLEGDFDIIAIVETWLHPDILDSEIFTGNSYVIYRRDRCVDKHQRGGGVLLAVKSDLSSSLLPLKFSEGIEQVCVHIGPSAKIKYSMYIFLSYIPPASHVDVYTKHLENILLLAGNANYNDNFIVLGDYNLPGISWKFDSDDKILIPFNISSEAERIFVDSLMLNNFTQINCVPNSHGKFLDLVFLSEDFRFSVFHVEAPLIPTDSHHYAVCILLDRYEFLGDLKLGMPSSIDLNFSKADFSALNNYISSVNWSETLNCLSLDDMYAQLIDSLL